MASREQGSKSGRQIPPELLLEAYSQGMFPMAEDGELLWFSPDPRGILPLEQFRIPRGLRTALKDPAWEIRVDTRFEEVLRACASREETWIDECIAQSYITLFALGFAHSVETWHEGRLVGGLYGVSLGAAFFGESMFHRVSNASKVALHGLVGILKQGGFVLLDTQWKTPHLEQFGARAIPRDDYLSLLAEAVRSDAQFGKTFSLSPFLER